jgi:choline kinase
MLCFMEEEDDKDPLNLLGLDKLYNEFVDQYGRLGFEAP